MVAGFMGMMFFLTQYMQEVLHYGPLETGLAYLPMTAATFGASQLSARVLVPRLSTRTLLLIAFGAAAAGLYWLSTLSTLIPRTCHCSGRSSSSARAAVWPSCR